MYNVFSLSRNHARSCERWFENLYGWELLKVSHNPANYDGQRHYVIGDIMVLVCSVILQEHEIKGSCDFMGKRPSK